MTEPDWNPDTGGRSLAEILREAGIESPSRPGRRRRWDDPDDTGVRQRRAEPGPGSDGERPAYGRRRSDVDVAGADGRYAHPAAAPERRDSRRVLPEPSTAAIPGLRPDRTPGVPHPSAPLPGTPLRDHRPAPPEDDHPSTGPIPVVRPDDHADDLDASPQESALAWLRFAGELVIALAAGVGVYFAATVVWELAPYAAIVLVPLAVTGLAAGVGYWRQRQGHEPVGFRLLAILVFAGTLLTIAPAARLLAGS
ncbi:MAG: hypothetical protein JF630_04000 [Geodermatophilales bacterium]|nr:hypothetical protein [Geodermatophilales bacterium]